MSERGKCVPLNIPQRHQCIHASCPKPLSYSTTTGLESGSNLHAISWIFLTLILIAFAIPHAYSAEAVQAVTAGPEEPSKGYTIQPFPGIAAPTPSQPEPFLSKPRAVQSSGNLESLPLQEPSSRPLQRPPSESPLSLHNSTLVNVPPSMAQANPLGDNFTSTQPSPVPQASFVPGESQPSTAQPVEQQGKAVELTQPQIQGITQQQIQGILDIQPTAGEQERKAGINPSQDRNEGHLDPAEGHPGPAKKSTENELREPGSISTNKIPDDNPPQSSSTWWTMLSNIFSRLFGSR